MFDAKLADGSLACIFSVSGFVVTDQEKLLFEQSRPFGFILFARNVDHPQQLRDLVSDLKALVGWDCPILIDQEGGRVQRMKGPHWPDYKSARTLAEEGHEAVAQETGAMVRDLFEAGINVNCSPVLDVFQPDADDIIGDRAFSDDPTDVAACGKIVCEQHLNNGVMPVIKHMPGHGRALADSHLALPTLSTSLQDLEKTDFVPFRTLSSSVLGPALWGMTAHIVYEAIDSDRPATLSEKLIRDTIRGSIGFEGFLLGDDLDMRALDRFGDVEHRCVGTLKAGCDAALYCSGSYDAMKILAEACPLLTDDSLERLNAAHNFIKTLDKPLDKTVDSGSFVA